MNNADRLRKQFAHYRQSNQVFIQSGRDAYHLGVHLQNNPYKEMSWWDLWDKGYRFERAKIEGPRRPPQTPPSQPPRPHPNQAQRPHPNQAPRSRSPYLPYTQRPEQRVRPQIGVTEEKRPAINLGRIARFNAKYHAAV